MIYSLYSYLCDQMQAADQINHWVFASLHWRLRLSFNANNY